MKIIIPMTGYGSRFVAAGYQELKPLIRVQGIPMLAWIVQGMYAGEGDFLFICRQEHLDTDPGMEPLLKQIAPNAEIYAVKDWIKKGPVFLIIMLGLSLVLLINLLTSQTGYSLSIAQAKEYYEQGDYVEAYRCFDQGSKVRKADEELYHKARLTAYLQQPLNR